MCKKLDEKNDEEDEKSRGREYINSKKVSGSKILNEWVLSVLSKILKSFENLRAVGLGGTIIV